MGGERVMAAVKQLDMLQSFGAGGQMSLSEVRNHAYLSFFIVIITRRELLPFLASNKK
jgi:hypothetical protein